MADFNAAMEKLQETMAVVAASLWAWEQIQALNSLASLFLATWLGLSGLLFWGAFRYDRESPEGKTRLIWLLGLGTFIVVAFALALPAMQAARRGR